VRVVGYVPDLMDRSRIQAAHPDVRLVATVAALTSEVGDADVVVLDLGRPGVVEALPALVGTGARVVGFASHVDEDLVAEATAAGCEVLPRSRFFRRVDEVLGGT
jgi:hypothetical protein